MSQLDSRVLGARRARRSVSVIARAHGLHRVGRRPPADAYLRQLVARRDFVWTYARSRLQAGNSRDRLGSLWLVLNPLLNGGLYYLVFGVLLDTRAGIENFTGYLLVGVFLFQFFARTLNEGSRVVVTSRRLIQALDFPAAVLPLAVVLRQLLAAVPAFVVMLAICALTSAPITWRWLLVLPVIALLTTFALGLTLLTARVVAAVHDVTNLVPFVLRGWLYLSGVFFSPDRFERLPAVEGVLEHNPMHRYLMLARDCLLYREVPSASDWLVATAWALGALLVGCWCFWRAEETYGRE